MLTNKNFLGGFPLFIKEAVKGYFLQKAYKCTRSIHWMPEGSTYWVLEIIHSDQGIWRKKMTFTWNTDFVPWFFRDNLYCAFTFHVRRYNNFAENVPGLFPDISRTAVPGHPDISSSPSILWMIYKEHCWIATASSNPSLYSSSKQSMYT